jgi:ABC-2 type transport system permease protein
LSQLNATFMKTAKFFVRNRALLLGIVAWPMVLMVIMASTELTSIPASEMPLALGALTVDMLVFALMLACIMNLPSSIARDREIGLLVKLRSMPIRPGIDTLGRLLAYLAFAAVVSGLVILLGLGLGAQFSGSATAGLEAVGFLLMAAVAAAGIGLILGSFIKSVQGTAFLGLAVTLALAFTSGILVPYTQLSPALQAFSRAFPISSAASSVGYLLLGQDVAGYDPMTFGQVAAAGVVAIILLALGLLLYHRTSWRQVSGTSNIHLGGRHRMGRRARTEA